MHRPSMREEHPPLGPPCAKTAAHAELTITGLFSGIGGLEEGFRRRGHHGLFLCEADPAARRVLEYRFPRASLSTDVRDLKGLPKSDVVTAGFPCQDLSQVGRCMGISGPDSCLIGKVFDLLRSSRSAPRWLVLENVPFMLRLDNGRAIQSIVQALDGMGWAWAYRTIDARAFGLPQRRRRVILLASRESDPRPALFGTDAGPPKGAVTREPCLRLLLDGGEYWIRLGCGRHTAPQRWLRPQYSVAPRDLVSAAQARRYSHHRRRRMSARLCPWLDEARRT